MPSMANLRNIKTLVDFVSSHTGILEINQNTLFCNACNKILSYSIKQGVRTVKDHVNSLKHKTSFELKGTQQRLQLTSNDSAFQKELLEAFLDSNIPLSKLNNNKLRAFIQKYTVRRVADESTLRRTALDELYIEKRDRIKADHINEPIYIIFEKKPIGRKGMY
jgi:hypothetical protein